MIYKLIILTASLLFIWEFMKVRSTAVAQAEPNFTNAWISIAQQNEQVSYEKPCKNMVSGIRGNVCTDDWDLTWLKLNGA